MHGMYIDYLIIEQIGWLQQLKCKKLKVPTLPASFANNKYYKNNRICTEQEVK